MYENYVTLTKKKHVKYCKMFVEFLNNCYSTISEVYPVERQMITVRDYQWNLYIITVTV